MGRGDLRLATTLPSVGAIRWRTSHGTTASTRCKQRPADSLAGDDGLSDPLTADSFGADHDSGPDRYMAGVEPRRQS
jgi:hypothetical protein